MENNTIVEIALDRLNQEGMWFTTKEDKLYANANNLYKLDEFGDVTEETKTRLEEEVSSYLGDGAGSIIEAVDQWLGDNLLDGNIGYVDTLSMNFELKETVEETNTYSEPVDADMELTVAEEADKVEESKKVETRVYMTVNNGDEFVNEDGDKIIVLDVNKEEGTVTYKWDGQKHTNIEPINMFVIGKQEQGYKRLNESKLEEGVKHRLEERNNKSAEVIEQALNGIDENTSEVEQGIIMKTKEIFNSLSDRGYDVQVSFDNGESTSSIAIGQQGANILITITNPDEPLRAFASGNFEINDDSLKMIKSIMEILK